MRKPLEVDAYLYGHKIGSMIMHMGRIYFEYDSAFTSLGLEISLLKLNTKKITSAYTNPDSLDYYHGMSGVFFQSLPDKHGMPFIDRYFERQGEDCDKVTLLQKLTFIADRGMGAIEYAPKEHEDIMEAAIALSAKELREEMRLVLEDDIKNTTIRDFMNIVNNASPIGGARPKLLISYNQQTGEIRSNSGTLQDGFVRSILKFDESYPNADGINESIELTKLEYLHMSLASECGITIPAMTLIEENGEHHLIFERYDRDKHDQKIHVCSAAGLMHKDIRVAQVMSYEELLKLTNLITKSQSDVEEMFRRMVFNALSFNVDDHPKNFEFMMDRTGQWRLAPAYDVTYSKGVVKEHLTTINGKSSNFSIDDFLVVAQKNLIDQKSAKYIINTTAVKLSTYKMRAKNTGISESEATKIGTEIHMQLVRLGLV
ncbi:MAG: type II toxin-antitoxin system HipA family toxin [Sulfuricurvum sp.]|uniref:type II toxin-antitoxin system HipA family toxin n=1 Tax=Sulfuricurvum sp. TaxID=2025608 RepID=UPI00260F063E|nr:type II toxin-antitoxin system HipA family toxin [Sulfuricurvum sp.]MDD2830519.1 type II toxin-antitoxin system HipA family toxin [Sulfuricurvum sp.]MDD4950670.1 type II toxin-antitoxin system HipA family toxin [Sulfuricurvum sp.]